MQKKELLYEGKAKKVYRTTDPQVCIVSYKDDVTARNGLQRGTVVGKGTLSNRLSNRLFQLLEAQGIPTHFVQEWSDRETVVKKVEMIPLEVIVRNVAAGSLSKRLGFPEGTVLEQPVLEFRYKNDQLGDPMVNASHISALHVAAQEELEHMARLSLQANQILREFFASVQVDLIDFKLEFGRTPEGSLLVADEISLDTCRLWDSEIHEKLDKDRLVQDLGGAQEAYGNMMRRLGFPQ